MAHTSVAIDATGAVIGGGVTYVRELIPRLCALAPDASFWVFLRVDLRLRGVAVPSNCTCVIIRFPSPFSAIWRSVWQQVILPFHLRKMRADVLLAPYDVAPLFAPCRVVLGIQNASPYADRAAGTWRQRLRERLLRLLTSLSTRRSARIFFVSEWSRQTISRRLGVPLEKSCVIHHGVSDRFLKPDEAPRPQDEGDSYVLVVGSVNTRRDYPTLLEAWKQVGEHHGRNLRLLIVGSILEWAYYGALAVKASDLGIGSRVAFLADVPSSEMPALYHGAEALVMASSVETFGLPMVEAMASGIPIVAADIPVAREVCGDAASYYRLGDSRDLADKLVRLLGNGGVRAEAQRAGRARARLFSWDTAATCTLQLLWEGPK